MVIDKALLEDVSVQTKTSPRSHMAYDLRNTSKDNFRWMYNVLEQENFLSSSIVINSLRWV